MDANQQRDLKLIEGVRSCRPGARDELVRKYLPLVKSIARRHYAGRLDFDDLVQEGLIGLLGAIEEYRPDKFSVRFSSFAYLCIVRKIYNAIKRVNGSRDRVHHEAVSLHSHVYGDETRTLLDLQADVAAASDPQEIVVNKMVAREMYRLLAGHLSLFESTVLAHLLQGFGCRDIGRRLGVDPKAVDNARTRVRLKLRRLLDRYGSLLDPRVGQALVRRRPPGREVRLRV